MASVTTLRIVTIVLLFTLDTRLGFSEAHLHDAGSAAAVSVPTLQLDRDPPNFDECLALGELNIVFRTRNDGPPNIGVVLTDPRGRRIGFDPLTKRGWQELPVAQGSIDCDESDDKDACRGLIEVCGALSGTYKLEVIPNANSDYTLTISARSQEVRNGQNLKASYSEYDFQHPHSKRLSKPHLGFLFARSQPWSCGPATKGPG